MGWPYLVMGNEPGNEPQVDPLLVAPAMSPPNLALVGNDDFVTEFSFAKLVFLSFRRYLASSSRNIKMSLFIHFDFLHITWDICTDMSGLVPPNIRSSFAVVGEIRLHG